MESTRPAAGKLELIAFASGAIVMIFEIAGSRVLAPFLGTSVFVWTTLIGVIMGSLSAGYWLGGRMADRVPTFRRLAMILFGAGVFAGVTALSQNVVLSGLGALGWELRVSALLATLVLFAPASTLLGMVSPYVVRLKLRTIETSGAHVGQLYAISTAGSIVGTFATGYFLLAIVGTSTLLYAIAICLIALSLFAAIEGFVAPRAGAAVFLLLAGALAQYERLERAAMGFRDFDTNYQRVQVIDATEPGSGRPMRLLKSEQANTQSAIYLDSRELASDYLRYFELVRARPGTLRRVLMIGAAGYVYPLHLLREDSGVKIDVVELDPGMTRIARDYFSLANHPRLRIFHEDGRTFVNRAHGRYDAVFIDAFQTKVPPFQLLTHEFVEALGRLLQPNGVVALNFIAHLHGHKKGLAPSVLRTFRRTFPSTSVFQVEQAKPRAEIQNLVLIAARQELRFDAEAAGVGRLLDHAVQDADALSGLLLTDDYAPVEHLIGQR